LLHQIFKNQNQSKMKQLTTMILAAATILGSTSCKKDSIGEGPVTSQTRNIQNFTGIDLRMNGNVYYTKSSTFSVEISAPQSIHSILDTYVDTEGRLVIRYNNGKTYNADDNIRIKVSAPAVNTFLLNTSGSIYAMNDIQPDNLLLRSSGSGDIVLQKVSTNSIDAESTQSGRISADVGFANYEKLKTDGSGKIDFSGIAVKTANARTIGSGDIKVKVSDNLDVRIDGSGSVYFSGNPYVTTHISGSGRLVRM
jgi:hypothetical protein